MLKNFKDNIALENLMQPEDVLLVAVSGGVDSMVLCDLLWKSKIPFKIAHCNFSLREEESDEDEKFVRNYAKEYKIPFFTKKFDTEKEAKQLKKGIQETARKLRYDWFKELREKGECTLLATAHQKNDAVETMIFNFTRGTGIDGLKGISIKRGNIIRPLLFAQKKEILAYAEKNKVDYREDSSNASEKYSRNKIRHTIIPELQNLNGSLVKTMYEKSKIFAEGSRLMNKVLAAEIKKETWLEDGAEVLSVSYIKASEYPRLLLWKWMEPCHFSSNQVDEVLTLLSSQAGKKVSSDSHKIVRGRSALYLVPKDVSERVEVIFKDVIYLKRESPWDVNVLRQNMVQISPIKEIAYLDLDKIEFPLTLRRWKDGDYFIPYGSRTKKKIKDFLTQEKVKSHAKKQVEVLVSGGEIIWVVGHRISNKYKITSQTIDVLILSS